MAEYKCVYCGCAGNLNKLTFVKDCWYCKTCESIEKLRQKCGELSQQPQPYYHSGTYEAINVIEAWGLNFCLGNVIKYVARAGRKTDNPIEDLEKAKWYIEREIEKLKGK
jgi:hypothetical protein